MRYWLILSEFPPDAGGGIATYGREFSSALLEAGHDVTVFVPTDEQRRLTELPDAGIRVVRVPILVGDRLDHAMGRWQLMSERCCNAVIAHIAKDGPPDLIEVQDYGGLGYALLKRRLVDPGVLAGVPISLFCHSPIFETAIADEAPAYLFPTYGVGRMEKFCLMAADRVICPSQFLANRLQMWRSDSIEVVPLPFSASPSPLKNESTSPTSPCCDLVYVGKAQYLKGVVQLLDAMRLIWAGGHRVRLRMVGGDTLWQSRQVMMKDYIRAAHAEPIRDGLLTIDEQVSPPDLPAVHASARFALVPSLFDNFPYTCIEALTHGRPVLASRSGGQADLLRRLGRDEWLFDISNPKDVAEVILRALGEPREATLQKSRDAAIATTALCAPAAVVAGRLAKPVRPTHQMASDGSEIYPFINDVEMRQRSGATLSSAFRGSSSESPLLSVIIPFYNLARTIDATISSVMTSTYANLEIIIVDDGSTDEAAHAALERMAAQSHRFPLEVLRIDNRGLANARNVGAQRARGELLAFLDADDMVVADFYAKSVAVLQRFGNVSYVYSWLEYFEGSEGCWITFDTDIPYLLGSNMTAAMLVVRKQDFLEFGLNRGEMKYGMEDYEAWIGMTAAGRMGVALPEFLVRYRVREGSMSRQFTTATVTWLYEQMVSMNPEIYRLWGDELAKLNYANGPGRLWNSHAVAHGEVGYVSGGAGFNYQALSSAFSPMQQRELLHLLSDAGVRRTIGVVLSWGLHRPLLAGLGVLSKVARALGGGPR